MGRELGGTGAALENGALTQDDWLQLGVKKGWCSEPVCATHAGLPSTEEEMASWDAGGDPCEYAVRLWEVECSDEVPATRT